MIALSSALVGVVAFVAGWFSGREYLKYEVRSAMQEASESVGKAMSTAAQSLQDGAKQQGDAARKVLDQAAKAQQEAGRKAVAHQEPAGTPDTSGGD